MAWNNKPDKDELAKEMFGEDAAAVKAKLAKLESIETAVKESRTTIERQNALIETLTNNIKEMRVTSPYEPTQQPQPQPQPTNQRIDWSEDADGAFNQRVAPLAAATLQTSSSLARREAMESLNDQYHDWYLFAGEIDELSKNSPMNQKVQPEFWKNCYFVAKGKHHDEIIRDQNMKSGKFYVETAGNSVVIDNKKDKIDADSLTEQEKKVALGMGLSLERYAEIKANGVRVNVKEANASA